MKEFDGKQEMIDPRKIVVDHRYQRSEKDPLIAAIAAEPKWELFGALICFRREGGGGLVYCGDGQQRLAGVLVTEGPPKLVPVVVHVVSGLADEAAIFVRINEFRAQLTALEKHRGKVTAKDPAALAIERATDAVGVSISGSSDSPRAITSSASLYYGYNLIGEQGVVQLLTLLFEAWPNDRKALSARMIRMLADIIDEKKHNGDFSRADTARKLSRTTPGTLLRKSEEIHFDTGKAKRDSLRAAFKAVAKV